MTNDSVYVERVYSTRWLVIVWLVPLAIGVGVAVSLPTDGAGRALGWAVVSLMALAIAFVYATFSSLLVAVTDKEVIAAFLVFHKRVPLASVTSARIEKYRWWTYGGWGMRRGLFSRRQAWSVPGPGTGVLVECTRHGKQHSVFISSKNPQGLLQAIDARLPNAMPQAHASVP